MSWFVYILQSEKDGDYYKGITENIELRLKQHNTGQSTFTSTKMPWQLVYSKEMSCKRDALIEERRHAVRHVRIAACRTTDKLGSPNQQCDLKRIVGA